MRHYRVTFADVVAAHREALTYGGRDGILNAGAIESAIGRPYSGYHRPIARKAAALLHAIVRNHGFVDGNKRTALLVTLLLVKRSGCDLAVGPNERIDELVASVADGSTDFDTLAAWLRDRLTRV